MMTWLLMMAYLGASGVPATQPGPVYQTISACQQAAKEKFENPGGVGPTINVTVVSKKGSVVSSGDNFYCVPNDGKHNSFIPADADFSVPHILPTTSLP